ncbi:MAG: L-lysine 6-transaminase [Planctomycetota bacterium]
MNRFTVAPDQIHPLLKKNILADGFHVAIDLERSHGSFIVDAITGREILDCYSYFASLPIGHNHPSVTGDEEFLRALQRAAIANPANSDIYAAEFASFVDTFARLARPEPFCYLFFIAGGALAVENALKTAFDWKVRKNRAAGRGPLGRQILHFREAFHGRSGYTLSLTNTDRVKIEDFPVFPWPRVLNPKLRFPLSGEVLAEVARAEQQAVREIEDAFARNPHDIAAIIIEPIQGEGGDNHFRPEFFRELRRLADEHEALLIFDEVQTGLGATGKLWAYEHTGVVPDIIAFGKKTQVCGIMAGARMDEVEEHVFRKSGRINSTWGGNLVDMVRGSKYLQVIHEEKLVENAARMGERLLAGLESLQARHPVISNVRGRGLFAAFTMSTPKERDRLRTILWETGLATLSSWPQSVRLRPCLNVNEAEIDRALAMIEDGLTHMR